MSKGSRQLFAARLRTCLYKEIVIYQCFVFLLLLLRFGFPLLFLNVFAIIIPLLFFLFFSFSSSIVAVICCRNNNNTTESKALPNFLSCANEKTTTNSYSSFHRQFFFLHSFVTCGSNQWLIKRNTKHQLFLRFFPLLCVSSFSFFFFLFF